MSLLSFLGADGQGRTASQIDRFPMEILGTPTVARQLTATATGQSVALTASCRRISIRARNADCRLSVGTSSQAGSVNASTSHFILAGERIDFAVPPSAHLGYLRDGTATSNGVLELTELG